MIPCGCCMECKKRLVSEWSFRLVQEGKRHLNALFVTLTYSTSHLTFTPNRYRTLVKRDVQLFMKRLRKIAGQGVRYFAVGEYGSLNWRPHYHLLLFGVTHQPVLDAWGLGDVHFGDVTGASIGYTLKYIMKPSRVPLHKNDDRQPEFRLMSKRLGSNYMTDAMRNYHLSAPVDHYHATLPDGRRLPLPRYYRLRIYDVQQLAAIKAELQPLALERHYNALEEEQLRNNFAKTSAQFRRERAEIQTSLLDAEAKKRIL